VNQTVRPREGWESLYLRRIGQQWQPAEDVVRFCARHLRTRIGPTEFIEQCSLRRTLDLGCGSGRHVVFLAQQGLDVCGVDISQEALDLCRAWLKGLGLSADLRPASVDQVPFGDGEFEVIVSFGVLDHVLKPVAVNAFLEIRRLLRPGGLLHVNLRSPESLDFGRGEELEPGTFVLTEGPEKGLAQHFWTAEEIDEMLAGFTILNWELQTRWLDKARTTRDARWAVSARFAAP
jgi:SAM-dependent methyltransferase